MCCRASLPDRIDSIDTGKTPTIINRFSSHHATPRRYNHKRHTILATAVFAGSAVALIEP